MRTGHLFVPMAATAILAGCVVSPPPQEQVSKTTAPYSSSSTYSYTNTAPPVMTTAVIAPGPVFGPGTTTTTTVVTTPMTARLGQGDVIALLSNNTVSGYDANGTPYRAFMSADGRYRMVYGNQPEFGSWNVLPDGRVCAIRAADGVQQCHSMWREGNAIRFDRPNGMTAGDVAIVVGNPQGL